MMQMEALLWLAIPVIGATLIIVILQTMRYFRENPRDKDDQRKPKL